MCMCVEAREPRASRRDKMTNCPTDGVPGMRDVWCCNWDSHSVEGRCSWYVAIGAAGKRGSTGGCGRDGLQEGPGPMTWLG